MPATAVLESRGFGSAFGAFSRRRQPSYAPEPSYAYPEPSYQPHRPTQKRRCPADWYRHVQRSVHPSAVLVRSVGGDSVLDVDRVFRGELRVGVLGDDAVVVRERSLGRRRLVWRVGAVGQGGVVEMHVRVAEVGVPAANCSVGRLLPAIRMVPVTPQPARLRIEPTDCSDATRVMICSRQVKAPVLDDGVHRSR